MLEKPRAFHDNLSMELSLNWHFQNRDYTSPAHSLSNHVQHNLMLINRWNWFINNFLILRSGLDYRFINLDSTEIGNRFRQDGGFYLTAELQLADSLLITPSVKLIFTSNPENYAVIPKLGLRWDITDRLIIKNNYFRSFKFPDFEELFWNGTGGIGNPNLRPEDGWGADIGVTWRLTDSLKFESVFFTQWIYDSIHWFSGSLQNTWRPENVGEAVFFGVESKINYNFPLSFGAVNRITVSLIYQYLFSYLLSYGYTFDSNKRIPYNPIHTVNGNLEIFWNSGSFSINGHFEDQRFHDTANLTILEPVFLLNASFKQKIAEHFILFGNLRNILNFSYESFYDYPMPGINLTLGLRINMEFN